MMTPCGTFGRIVLLVITTAALVTFAGIFAAWPRDLDGRYAQSPLQQWFNSLKNKNNMPCCDLSDGYRIDDADWDTQDQKYRVRIDGQWIVVPDDAVLTQANRAGYPIVWPRPAPDGGVRILCFMPGSGA